MTVFARNQKLGASTKYADSSASVNDAESLEEAVEKVVLEKVVAETEDTGAGLQHRAAGTESRMSLLSLIMCRKTGI